MSSGTRSFGVLLHSLGFEHDREVLSLRAEIASLEVLLRSTDGQQLSPAPGKQCLARSTSTVMPLSGGDPPPNSDWDSEGDDIVTEGRWSTRSEGDPQRYSSLSEGPVILKLPDGRSSSLMESGSPLWTPPRWSGSEESRSPRSLRISLPNGGGSPLCLSPKRGGSTKSSSPKREGTSMATTQSGLNRVSEGQGEIGTKSCEDAWEPWSRGPSLVKGDIPAEMSDKVMQSTRSDTDCQEGDSFLSYFIQQPNASRRLFWDLLGMSFILYDMLMIPMVFFDLEPSIVTISIDWVILCFWTIDIVSSFSVGYFDKHGVMILKPRQVACNYVRSWFFFDVIVVSIDWFVVVNNSGDASGDDAAVRAGKTFRLGKTLRILRMIRLFRVAKMLAIMSHVKQLIRSEYAIIILGLSRFIATMLFSNHVIACCWYGVGQLDYDHRVTWVQVAFVPEDGLGYRYMTSLHWSLTQLMPASMEVYPRNVAERFFNLFVVLFAIFAFTSLVSNITTALTHLRNLNSKRTEQQARLRQYLEENQISRALISIIWGCVNSGLKQSDSRLHEDAVDLLALLPEGVTAALHVEIYIPILECHPFFLFYASYNPMPTRKFLDTAMSILTLNEGQHLFSESEPAVAMYFLMKGRLQVRRLVVKKSGEMSSLRRDLSRALTCSPTEGSLNDSVNIDAGNWIAEVSLWRNWIHKVTLIATECCELARIDAAKFRRVLDNHAEDRQVKHYANLYQSTSLIHEAMLDVWCDADITQTMACQSFGLGASAGGSVVQKASSNRPIARISHKLKDIKHGWSLGSVASIPASLTSLAYVKKGRKATGFQCTGT